MIGMTGPPDRAEWQDRRYSHGVPR